MCFKLQIFYNFYTWQQIVLRAIPPISTGVLNIVSASSLNQKYTNQDASLNKIIFAILFLLIVTTASASESIVLGKLRSIDSKIMNGNRPYMVYLPPSYQTSKNDYPVIYLLDGDAHRFKGFVGVLESLSTATLDNQVAEAIVIAIPNTNRSRDLTPTVLKEWTFKTKVLDTFEETGNANQFLAFLNKELIPIIESKYRASSQRVLVGESFGGLFAAYALLDSSSMFSDFLIIDPTALWDNDYLNRSLNNRESKVKISSNVFFGFANNSHLGEIGLTNYKWGSAFASAVIKETTGIAKQDYFEAETHGTVALLAWYGGLKTLLPAKEK